MTGAAIVRWESVRACSAVRGALDGASAWALRNDMDESPARDFIIDLTHAVEACDFAAVLLAAWLRGSARGGGCASAPDAGARPGCCAPTGSS